MEVSDNWKSLIEAATKYEAELFARVTKKINENKPKGVRVVAQ